MSSFRENPLIDSGGLCGSSESVRESVCMCAKEWLPGKVHIFHHIGRDEKNGILEKSREGEENIRIKSREEKGNKKLEQIAMCVL